MNGKNENVAPFRYLELTDIGPASHMVFEPGERLTILTGDNGLGKTFLLDCLMWAVSAQWPGLEARPQEKAKSPRIVLDSSTISPGQLARSEFDYSFDFQSWTEGYLRSGASILTLYARADGSVAFWDVQKNRYGAADVGIPRSIWGFSEREIWDGIAYRDTVDGQTKHLCNGLIADWVNWQYRTDRSPFHILERILTALRAPDLQPFTPGEPTRLPKDTREMPTLRLPYGETPILHTSAGVRRILSLAYMLIWLWYENKKASEQMRTTPLHQMLIIVDEIEAHLHPKWQRVILSALMEAAKALDQELNIQFVVATHSPLVLASAEPFWNEKSDKLYHLHLTESGEAALEAMPFDAYGEVDNWLTSELFDLKRAGSLEAEKAIERAKALQLEDKPWSEAVEQITLELQRTLSAQDAFWPRWRYFAEQHGVKL